jgi:hypothetical protein
VITLDIYTTHAQYRDANNIERQVNKDTIGSFPWMQHYLEAWNTPVLAKRALADHRALHAAATRQSGKKSLQRKTDQRTRAAQHSSAY